MDSRSKHVIAHHLLLHLDEIPVYWRQRRWAELAALVEFVQRDVPAALSKTDPRLYRLLRNAITEFHLMGYDRFNLSVLENLAARPVVLSQNGKPS